MHISVIRRVLSLFGSDLEMVVDFLYSEGMKNKTTNEIVNKLDLKRDISILFWKYGKEPNEIHRGLQALNYTL